MNKHKLREKRKLERLKNMDELIETGRFISVYCATCEKINKMKDTAFILCKDAAELRKTAREKHTEIIQETGIICANPQFIITYELVLIDKSLINGKQASGLIM